jgi:hypothetical protein
VYIQRINRASSSYHDKLPLAIVTIEKVPQGLWIAEARGLTLKLEPHRN